MLWLAAERSRRDSGFRQGNDVLLVGDPVASVQVASGPDSGARAAYERAGVLFGELEHAGHEIEVIADVLSTGGARVTKYVRGQATEGRLRQGNLAQYRILHFATHAIADDEINWLRQPALLLSPNVADPLHDGLLQMGEIFDLEINADLVVLSACDTGGGKLRKGEGVIGLTRAFLYAGSLSVVASLWKVYDESTGRFMEYFYRYVAQGESTVVALRKAKLDLMDVRGWNRELGREESMAAPYFWAPFVLVGSQLAPSP
jgi:CHAT domain-containing protein